MALTETEDLRIQKIETKLNDIQKALNRLATRKEMKAYSGVRQSEIIDLQNRVDNLQSQVTALLSS